MEITHRRLPHIHEIGRPLFVTFRLHDSLPTGRIFRNASMTSGKAFVCMDRLLDSGRSGPLYLQLPEIAQLVIDELHEGSKNNYDLHAWVVMPNHVHLLITPQIQLRKLMQKLKGSTAYRANRLLNRTGETFWQEESYDHLVRDAEQFRKIARYIIQNPVKAGLSSSPEQFPWSSVGQT